MEEKTGSGVVKARQLALIVTGGFCDTDALSGSAAFGEIIRDAFVIAADGGVATAQKLGLAPSLVVGDFDTYTGELPDGAEVLQVPAEKDVTDTVLACEIAMERGFSSLVIAGGTGGRADHSLANILWLYSVKKRGAEALLTDGQNEFRVLHDEEACLCPDPGWRYFSLFALEDAAVRVTGSKYPIPERTPLTWENPSFAVSNEVTGKGACVKAWGYVLLVRSRG